MDFKRTTLLIITATLLSTLCGCAKFPSTAAASGKQLIITMRVRGRIEPVDTTGLNVQRHYFIAIDNETNPNVGPLAAIYPPYGGTGWVTSQDAQHSVGLTSFIQYDATNPQGNIYGVLPGSFFINRTFPQEPTNYEILEGGSAIRFVVDFSQIATAAIPADQITNLNINFITTNSLPIANEIVESRQTDGLGPSGQDYVSFDTTQDQLKSGIDEDAPNLTLTDPDLDIISWSIEVQTINR